MPFGAFQCLIYEVLKAMGAVGPSMQCKYVPTQLVIDTMRVLKAAQSVRIERRLYLRASGCPVCKQ